ncbi:MAG: crossover junction endodeoxyribonuclease RuvC [Alphaproteobacteria bacterium]|jgi:crossover junction endodeoxyribonuclease RuvC|nr:crossover junction endodeoxyribonuclease RuvC [Alphaproteobacteria bacterium]
MRILGIDPGLRCTGWGVIDFNQGRLQHIANGAIRPDPRASDADRLTAIYQGLSTVIVDTDPDIAAIEEIFVAKSARSALRLGMARGVGILACGTAQIMISEIAARAVKKAVVGTGGASKEQVQEMVVRLLQVRAENADAADALAIAIAASNDAGKPAGIAVMSAHTTPDDPLSRAISQALARDDAKHRGQK